MPVPDDSGEMTRNAQKKTHPTIDELCAEYRNENPHTEFVTRLALQIFDAVRTDFNFRKSDRLLLEAAARLHDIGYSVRPDDHVAAGAEIVRASGLNGYSDRQTEDIAAIMSLHGRLTSGALADEALMQASRPERIFQLGAILRVADALDQGHLQECRIAKITREEGMFRIYVATPLGVAGIERAMAKSDLWQRVFPLGVAFEARPRRVPPEPQADQPAGDAIRRMMLAQYRVLRTSARRAAREDDEEALHDLRIAVRSLRRLLEAFERVLRKTSAAEVEAALRTFAKRLGPARDLDVWIGILRKPRVQSILAEEPAFLGKQEAARAKARAELRAHLDDSASRALLARLGYLLRIELSHAGSKLDRPFGPLIRRCVKAAWKAVMAKKKWADSRRPDTLHQFRIRLRKLRLLASLSQPALHKDAAFMIAAVHDLERNLGRIHDLDEALIRADRGGAPDGLIPALAKRRRKEMRRFRTAWKNFTANHVQRRCRAAWR